MRMSMRVLVGLQLLLLLLLCRMGPLVARDLQSDDCASACNDDGTDDGGVVPDDDTPDECTCDDCTCGDDTVVVPDDDTGVDCTCDDDLADDAMPDDCTCGGDDTVVVPTNDDTPAGFNYIASILAGGLADQGGVTTFYNLLQVAGLLGILNTETQMTVLAPFDDAFATVELPEDPEELQNLLLYHIVPNQVIYYLLLPEGEEITMANSQNITITSTYPFTTINQIATTIGTRIPAANGAIQIIDAVLIPQTLENPVNGTNMTSGGPNGTDPYTPTPAMYNGTVGSPTPAPTPRSIYGPSSPTTVVTPQPGAGGQNGTDVIGPGGMNETDPYAPTSAPATVASPTQAPIMSNMGSPTPAPITGNMGSPTLAPITGGNINRPSSPTTTSPIPGIPSGNMPSGTVWDTIDNLDDVSEFKDALETFNVNLLLTETLPGVAFTVFAPVDTATENNPDFQFYLDSVTLWNGHLNDILSNHIVVDPSASALLQYQLFAGMDSYSIPTLGYQPIVLDVQNQLVSGHSLIQADLISANGVVHVVDGMLSMEQFSQNLIQLLENWDETDDAATTTTTQNPFSKLLDLLDNTNLLTERTANGMTFLAPTDMALDNANYMSVDGEGLAYHMIPSNVYKRTAVVLVSTEHPTADMWVTVNDGGIVSFNGVPSQKTVLGQNGVLYVIEEVLTPPIMANMLYLGALDANLTVSISAALLANAWPFQDGLLGNNDASRVTFLAPDDTFWASWALSFPAAEELLDQLLSQLWAPHTRDLLSHAIITTSFSREELADLASDGIVQLPTLAGTNITLQVSQNGQITVGDGIILDPPMRATDGVIHMVSSMNLPPSMTNNIFDLITTDPMNANLTNLLIDTSLAQTLSSLSPATFFVPPDASLAGIKLSNLESHIFQDLYYASRLMEMDGQVITSINRKRWVVSILDGSIFLQSEGSGSVVAKVQARQEMLGINGILHSIDALLDITQAPTASPSTNSGPTGVGGTASNQTSGPSIATTNPLSNSSNISSPMPSPNSTIAPTLSPSGNLTIVRVNTSFILYNTDGLKAQGVSQPEHARILNTAFSDFVESLVTDVEGQRQSQPPRNLRVAWRRLTAALQPNSPSVFAVRDIVCPSEKTPPIPNNASCQNLYGRFDLAVSDEDPEIVQDVYINSINQALDNGRLQDALENAAPTSPFVVVGKGPTEEEGNGAQTIPPEDAKMDWWMIVIIVLSCVLGCCCIAGYGLVLFMSNKKPEDGALVERLMDTDETPPDTPPKDSDQNLQDDEDLLDDDEEEDYTLDDPRSSEQWRQQESVNKVQAEDRNLQDDEDLLDDDDEKDYTLDEPRSSEHLRQQESVNKVQAEDRNLQDDEDLLDNDDEKDYTHDEPMRRQYSINDVQAEDISRQDGETEYKWKD